jgi:pyridoxal phosphate phosphatase PHOSPHO2
MCKGDCLEDYIDRRRSEDGTEFDFVAYGGDGANDLCAVMRLSENDLAFPRKDYKLVEAMEGHEVRAEVNVWEDGMDILNRIKKRLLHSS